MAPEGKDTGAQQGPSGILYVGDSLGVGVRDYGNLNSLVDAKIDWDVLVGRNSKDGANIIQNKLSKDHGTVVFDLGTNDGSASVTRDSLASVINAAGKRNVVTATISETSRLPAAPAQNKAIRRLADDHSNVYIVEWDKNRTDLSDGVHPSIEGAGVRARLFAQTLNHLSVPPGGTSPPGSSTTTSGVTAGFDQEDLFAATRAGAFSTQFELPGLLNFVESSKMKGAKSIYNDEPLMDFVKQVCQGSLREFQSLPNGSFFAFYPDQFGIYGHRKPYWSISDVEVIDGNMEITDDALATHVFVVGDTVNPDGAVDIFERVASKGVITIFDAFSAAFMINKGEEPTTEKGKKGKTDVEKTVGFQKAYNFLRKYGVRPHYEEAVFIRNPYFEMFYAFIQFQKLWANQYVTTFSFTFMPELYPGGIVAFEDHDIQCYIDSVTHSFDYESGFTTQASLSAPSAKPNSDLADLMVHPFTIEDRPLNGNGSRQN